MTNQLLEEQLKRAATASTKAEPTKLLRLASYVDDCERPCIHGPCIMSRSIAYFRGRCVVFRNQWVSGVLQATRERGPWIQCTPGKQGAEALAKSWVFDLKASL